MIERRSLGKLNESILPLGLGCAAIGGYYVRDGRVASRGTVDAAAVERAIHYALDNGIQLFDVANIYGAGDAERLLGRSLAGRRQQAILQVKFGASFDEVTRSQIEYDAPFTSDMIQRSLAASMRRLRTDYIDIFQFQNGQYPREQLADIVGNLDRLVEAGQIRAYSYGTRDIEQLRPFVEGRYCGTVITNHNILSDAAPLLDFLAKNGVALLAGMPLFMGFLTGRYTPTSQFAPQDVRASMNLKTGGLAAILKKIEALRPILTQSGRSMVQAALAWLWARHPLTIPVVGFKDDAQVSDSITALAKGGLSLEEMAQVAEVVAAND